MKIRGHFIIEGRVQGVCFRMCALAEAERLGLSGWVRNCVDGAVETVAEGPEKAVAEYLAWCRHGPPYARVLSVKDNYSDYTGKFDGFSIRT